MKHQVTANEHTITVTYIDELTIDESVKISEKVIEFATGRSNPMNILMDVNKGYAKNTYPIIKACAKLVFHMKKFNCCYICGDNEQNFKYAVTFFNTIGASKDKAFFMDTVDEALKDIEIRWSHYQKKNAPVNK